jgi:hypothetical protein
MADNNNNEAPIDVACLHREVTSTAADARARDESMVDTRHPTIIKINKNAKETKLHRNKG